MNRYKNISKDVLVERAKELECLYLIDEVLAEDSLSEALIKITKIIPLGFRNIIECVAVIQVNDQLYETKPITEKGDELVVRININNENIGYIKVMYPYHTFPDGEQVFLPQEIKLLNTIANRISDCIQNLNHKNIDDYRKKWETIIDLLHRTDPDMLLYVCEKMLALLANTSQNLILDIYQKMDWMRYTHHGEINFPLETIPEVDVNRLCQILFQSARNCLTDAQIYDYTSLWIYQGKTYELIKTVDKKDADVKIILKALNQYRKAVQNNEMSSEATRRWLTVELVRRFITDNPKSIAIAQKYITVEAFCDLLDSFICSPNSIGKIGGKGTGFFLAHQIIDAHKEENDLLSNVRFPRTWYISSDELTNLIENNGLDELNEHKYLDIIEIRTSYPRIIQMLKSSNFSSYVLNDLNQILEHCQDKPLIVRSSSLLEDQINSAFSGKYKSLFITNTGTKAERQRQLVQGILEVYASMFNPDSIQYRKERNLLDCSEQMGIMIQEVVGTKVGPYYFPLFAGVAFSNNELRWSPRLKREDGLIRLVMGLGTRAVDRVGDDYPTLISPGQPNLRVNQQPRELKKYSPQMMDVIDIEHNRFLTLPILEVIKEYGYEIPCLNYVASVLNNDIITDLNRFTTDLKSADIIITFDGMNKKTTILKQIQAIMSLLQEKLGYPVDIEFASDGEAIYLLQCRPQSRSRDNTPAAIPTNIPAQSTVFTANKYISNGKVTGIRSVVYVDPIGYSKLEKYEDLISVGSAVSEINRILPRRSFILMGPGRWGSRGDIKLGVPIAYSDINNCAMLIEIAQKESKYQPELSFGTHFFQDLVEENIKYLPLYPEDSNVIFNKAFFLSTKNALRNILPNYAYLEDVIKVVQVEENFYGQEMIVLMNADLEKAIAYIEPPAQLTAIQNTNMADIENELAESEDQGWKWRHYMAERIAAQIDMEAFGIKGIYLFGSTNNCTARLNSDIDLLIHIDASDEQKQQLTTWLNGWSIALSEMNYLKTGYKSDGLLDIHYITDQDIRDKTSYAIKINSVYDPAHPLRVRN